MINIDHQTVTPTGEVAEVSRIKRLHPTLRKCKCGYIDTKHNVLNHIIQGLHARSSKELRTQNFNVREFWKHHGEVPLNEGEGKVRRE